MSEHMVGVVGLFVCWVGTGTVEVLAKEKVIRLGG